MSVTHIDSFQFTSVPCGSKFLIDTNVLFFVHSGYFLSNPTPKHRKYSNFVRDIANNNHVLCTSVLNIQELFHIIENHEYNAYLDHNSLTKDRCTKKQFRKDAHQRQLLKGRLSIVMTEITSLYEIFDVSVTHSQINAFLNSLSAHLYDPIDYFVVDSTKKEMLYFLTDDSDFQIDSSINVVTR